MRKLLYTFSLIAALLCASAPSAFAWNNRKQQNFQQNRRQRRQTNPYGGMQNLRRRSQVGTYGTYGEVQNLRRRSQVGTYGTYGEVQNLRHQGQFTNQYGNQNFHQNRRTQGYGRDGRFMGGGEVRDYGRSFGGYDRYYGERFIVDHEYDDWGAYGYPFPILFSDCYDGDWLYPDPDQGTDEITVVFHHHLVTAYWDPYLGGYYIYDRFLGYIQVA